MYIVPVTQIDSKNILRMFSRIRPDRSQNSAYITGKGLIVRVLCVLFEQIPFGMNRDILKKPTLCEAKNSNKLRVPSHLVTRIPHTVTMNDRCSCITYDSSGKLWRKRSNAPYKPSKQNKLKASVLILVVLHV